MPNASLGLLADLVYAFCDWSYDRITHKGLRSHRLRPWDARLVAGMHGFSFMQVLEGVMETDLYKKRGFMGEDKYRVIECPYTGKEILTVPSANPDVCIIHVQRADKYGNAQY